MTDKAAGACLPCPVATPAGRPKAARSVGRCGAMNPPPGSSSPVSSKITTPLQSRLQPCSGGLTRVCAASRSGAEGAGQGGVCLQISVPAGFIVRVFGWLACRSSCCGKTSSVNPGGGLAEMANPNKAHHQGRSHPLPHGELLACFGAAGVGEAVESAGAGAAGSSCRAGYGSVLMTCGQCAG
jgi:hypothetical protein